MGHLEKRIITGALGLVAVLLTIVIFKGLTPSEQEVLFIPLEEVAIEVPVAEQQWPKKTAQQPKEHLLVEDKQEFVVAPNTEALATVAVTGPVVEEGLGTAHLPDKTLYTIRRGDILGMIAQNELGSVRYVDKIKDLNPGIIASNLVIGDVLVLPAKHTLQVKPSAKEAVAVNLQNIHVVVSGDSLYEIAGKYYPGKHEYLEKIVASNKDLLVDGRNTLLRVGWKLNLPE
jgi:nucleoid-associated protein YgaU